MTGEVSGILVNVNSYACYITFRVLRRNYKSAVKAVYIVLTVLFLLLNRIIIVLKLTSGGVYEL